MSSSNKFTYYLTFLELYACYSELAAKEQLPAGQYNLGLMYNKGYYVAQNRQIALDLYKKSAKQGYAKAQYNLGNAYATGDGVSKNDEKAVELFTKAAQQNFPEAQYNLGNAYVNGRGITKNNQKALELFTKAAEQNFPEAQYNLAYMYENIFLDLEKAMYWYKKASENKISEASKALERLTSLSKQ